MILSVYSLYPTVFCFMSIRTHTRRVLIQGQHPSNAVHFTQQNRLLFFTLLHKTN